MKFHSNSVTLNRGVQTKINVVIPSRLETYSIDDNVWKESIIAFNKELDDRSTVSEIINGIKVDILRILLTMNTIVLWMTVKESDIEIVQSIKFMLKGKVVFEDDKTNKVERLIIQDILYGRDRSTTSIFKKKKKELTSSG